MTILFESGYIAVWSNLQTTMSLLNLEAHVLTSGSRLSYRVKPGDGNKELDPSLPSLVLFHSFLMDSRLYSPQFADAAYAGYNLIAFDEYGHGASHFCTETEEGGFSFWDTARDSLEVLKHLDVHKFWVLGTSQGGFIAMRIALLLIESTNAIGSLDLKGLILLGTNAFAESEQNINNFKSIRDKWCSTPVPTQEALLGKTGSFGGPKMVGEKVYKKICDMWISRHSGEAGYNPALAALCERDDISGKLTKIQVPCLVMHGTADKVYSVEEAQKWSKMLGNQKGLKFVVVENGQHYLSFTQPGTDACRTEVRRFIEETKQ